MALFATISALVAENDATMDAVIRASTRIAIGKANPARRGVDGEGRCGRLPDILEENGRDDCGFRGRRLAHRCVAAATGEHNVDPANQWKRWWRRDGRSRAPSPVLEARGRIERRHELLG